MGRIKHILETLTSNNNYEEYLPIFRLYIAFHILKRVFLNWGAFSFVYSPDVYYRNPNQVNSFFAQMLNGVPLIAYVIIILAIFFLLGVGKNFVILLLFLAMFYYNAPFLFLLNGGDNLLQFILAYMVFTNSYKYYTIFKSQKNTGIRNLISNLACLSIMIHLCIVYIVSGLHKVHSDIWFNGVATYYILHIERFSSPINELFYNNKFFIMASTYITLIFELLFPILIWNNKFKPLFLLIGVLLHISIYLTMMIYDFEILFIMIYGFFISNKYWRKINNLIQIKFKKYGNYNI